MPALSCSYSKLIELIKMSSAVSTQSVRCKNWYYKKNKVREKDPIAVPHNWLVIFLN